MVKGTSPQQTKAGIDFELAEARFDSSRDGTVGIEEEFALVDPVTLDLADRFEFLREQARRSDQRLFNHITGELISSEIEIVSGPGANLQQALERQRDHRRRLFSLCEAHQTALAACGTHPFADYREQRIIDTDHYRRVEQGLRYVAWRNNTFSLHVHVGIRTLERAVAVCDRLREVLPLLLAISANSPFLDGRDSGLHSARSQCFTRSFPRCGVPDHFGSWRAYRAYLEFLVGTASIVEFTQVWWSVRPHLDFGTVEVRICDAQSDAAESEALASLIVAAVLQAARDADERVPLQPLEPRLIEENLWRAIRYGLDGKLIDLRAQREYPAREALERLLHWTEPVRGELGLGDPAFPERNGAQRQRRALGAGATLNEVFAESIRETQRSYAEGVRA